MALMTQWTSAVTPVVQQWVTSITWIDVTEFFFVAMSVVGQHFISRRSARGFGFWIAGNLAALVMFVALGRWLTVLLYLYFLYMCGKGLVTWRELDASTGADRGPTDGLAQSQSERGLAHPVA